MARLRPGLEQAIIRRGAEIAGRARRNLESDLRKAAPIGKQVPGGKTPGGLKKSVSVAVRRQGFSFRFLAKATKDYAEYTNTGSSAHRIRPRRGRVLRFYWPRTGQIEYFRQVQHPGTRGTGWWDKTLRSWPQILRRSR